MCEVSFRVKERVPRARQYATYLSFSPSPSLFGSEGHACGRVERRNKGGTKQYEGGGSFFNFTPLLITLHTLHLTMRRPSQQQLDQQQDQQQRQQQQQNDEAPTDYFDLNVLKG